MYGILIQYDYDGDEDDWLTACEAFVTGVNSDPALQGKFSYRVHKAIDGNARVHVGKWDSPETLAHLQAQDFFKAFAAKVGEFAGGDQTATRLQVAVETTG